MHIFCMPRAHRHFIPGHIWHLTHRCHNKQFLLDVSTDRASWTRWAREAKKRFGFCILDYCITGNHVHVIVRDVGDKDTIARSMQLIAGRTAQEYNERKKRFGAFWEDRYHATAVESGSHLMKCIAYIDLNMVRAGVIEDPLEWQWGGYHDIQSGRRRNQIIDYAEAMRVLSVSTMEELQLLQKRLVADAIRAGLTRQPEWTEAVAVGSRSYVESVAQSLGDRIGRRLPLQSGDSFLLREPTALYGGENSPEIASIRGENTLSWRVGSL